MMYAHLVINYVFDSEAFIIIKNRFEGLDGGNDWRNFGKYVGGELDNNGRFANDADKTMFLLKYSYDR